MAVDSHTTQITKDPKPPRTWKLRCGNKDCRCEWVGTIHNTSSVTWIRYEVMGSIRVCTFICPACSYIIDVKHDWRTNIGLFGLWVRTPW